MSRGLFPAPRIQGAAPPLSGRVYGTLLSHRAAYESLKPVMSEPPYGGPPKAPVLYIKPRNSLAGDGDPVVVPSDVEALEAAACLGLVIGQTACNVARERALSFIGGYVVVNDVSVPHTEYYRPAIRLKCRDGFCPIGAVVPTASVANPDALNVRTFVDGRLRSTASSADLIHPLAQILSEVTEFMTLNPGDVLAVRMGFPAPHVRAGERVRVEIDHVGALENPFVAAGAART